MPALLAFLREWIIAPVVLLSLASGLVGAYGRERHEGRRPDGAWWVTRLCIMPVLAIVSFAIIDQFNLTRQQSALLSALLALMGYEAVRMILDRAIARGGALVDAMIPATPKPYASLIETDEVGRPTAHVILTPGDGSAAKATGQALHEVYDRTAREAPSGDMQELLKQLDRGSTDADRDPSPNPPVQPR